MANMYTISFTRENKSKVVELRKFINKELPIRGKTIRGISDTINELLNVSNLKEVKTLLLTKKIKRR